MMATLLTQCPHCQTSFKVNQTQLHAAQGLVRCGACLGVFAARANVIRVKTASSLNRDKARLATGSTAEPPKAAAVIPPRPAKASTHPDVNDQPLAATRPASPSSPAPDSARVHDHAASRLDLTLNSEGNFTTMLQPFGYRPGEFRAGINDDPGLSARQKRITSQGGDQPEGSAAINTSAEPLDDFLDEDAVVLGDMQLEVAPLDEYDDLQGVTPDLKTLLAEEDALPGEQANSGYQEYLEYEDEVAPANLANSPGEEGADPYLNRLPFVEVEEYEDDLELDTLISPATDSGVTAQARSMPFEPAGGSTDSSKSPNRPQPGTASSRLDHGSALGTTIPPAPAEQTEKTSTGSWSAYEDATDEDESGVDIEDSDEGDYEVTDIDFEDDLSPAFGDSDLGDDADAEDEYAADAGLTPEEDSEYDDHDEGDVEEQDEYYEEDALTGLDEEAPQEYAALDDPEEFLDDDPEEDQEDARLSVNSSTRQIRQPIIHEESSTTLHASKALLNRYLQNLEDDDALDELPAETLEYVDEEPVTIASSRAPRKILATVGFGLLNLGLIALIALQFINSNLEQLNRSARFDVLRPYVCQVLSCPAPPERPSSTLNSQQLLVRMHPRISDALELSFIFLNDSPQDQDFPGLELSFRDDNDALVASRLFTPAEYLPPELRTIAQMPAQSSVQIQLDLQDPGPQALHYSVTFRDL